VKPATASEHDLFLPWVIELVSATMSRYYPDEFPLATAPAELEKAA